MLHLILHYRTKQIMRWCAFSILLTAGLTSAQTSVTVYNSNLGVVTETRQLSFDKGIGRISVIDVPDQIDAASVRFDVPGVSNVTILEQNYAYDLVSTDQLYQRYIDQPIEVISKEGKLFGGKLLSFTGGMMTLQQPDGSLQLVNTTEMSHVNLSKLPEGLITRPTLFWRYQSGSKQTVKGELSYQTTGMGWNAEYIGVLDKNEKMLDLSGWASITNNSGKSFADAKLKLIAGEIQRMQQPIIFQDVAMYKSSVEGRSTNQSFQEKSFFEYHLYTLPRPATVANKEIKQISLFDPSTTGVQKLYTFHPGFDDNDVKVKVKFVNSAAAGLGMPLPEGRVRLFKADDDKGLILLGEDRLEHTPSNEEVKLTVGTAFDIKAEERVMNQKQISNRVTEYDYEFEIRNQKKEAVTVNLEKNFYGFWEIMNSSREYKKKNATTITMDIPAPAGDTVVVTMRVRTSY